METGVTSQDVKHMRRQAEHLIPASAKVKNRKTIFPLLHKSTWRGA
jgi:hypothetical protein